MATFTITNTTGLAFADSALTTQQMNVFVSGVVTSTSITLAGLSHSFPDDLDILLYAADPLRNLLFMSDVGSTTDIVNQTLTFSDDAAVNLPDGSAPAIVSGSYRPTNFDVTETNANFGLAVPLIVAGPGGAATLASAFNGATLAGAWTLAVRDDAGADVGGLTSWALNFSTSGTSTTIAGTAGTDQMIVTNGVGAGTGTLTLNGQDISFTGLNTVLFNGGASDDFFSGGSETDVIDGGSGQDGLLGGDGDDTLKILLGADDVAGETYSGGAGFDTLQLGSSVASYQINLRDDTLESIERVIFNDPGFSNFAGFTIRSSQLGTGLSTSAQIDGSFFFDVTDSFTIQMDSANSLDLHTLTFSNFTGALDSVIVNGTAFNDTVTGTSVHDEIHGAFGNDTLDGAGGGDLLDGGLGNDTAYYYSSLNGVTVNLTGGAGSGGDAEGDTFSSIENIIGSNTGADTLTGGSEANFFSGFGGADTLDGGGGGDSLFGGDGDDILRPGSGFDNVVGGNDNDTVDYSTSVLGVGVHLLFGGGFGGDAISDGITGIENVMGSLTAGDTLYGDNAANNLMGQGGDDTLHGSGGADVMDGGAGTGDTAYYFASVGQVVVDISGVIGVGGDAAGDTFIGIENLIGSNNLSVGDVLTGNNQANFINGYGGADFINGGLGNDTLFGGVNGDTFRFSNLLFGFDVIGDWEDGSDHISLSSGVAVNMAGVSLLQLNPNSWFVTIGTQGITVNSASAFTLDASDFLFV